MYLKSSTFALIRGLAELSDNIFWKDPQRGASLTEHPGLNPSEASITPLFRVSHSEASTATPLRV
jgi:hypothetical protein